MLAHRTDKSWVVDADSLRYAPPERLSGIAEDPSADTCALTLIALLLSKETKDADMER